MTSISRRQVLIGFGAVGATALLAACTSGGGGLTPTAAPPPTGKPIDPLKVTGEVKVWNFPTQVEAIINKDFASFVPNATVKTEQIALADLEERLLVSLATGTSLPDAASLTLRNSTQFVDTGAFVDLTAALSPYLADLADSSLVRGANGEIFGYTIGSGNMALWLHDAALAEKGVDVAELTTWDAMLDAARKLKKDSKGEDFIFIQPDGSNGFNNFNAFYQSAGGNWWLNDGQVNEDQDAALATLDFFKTIVADEKLAFRSLWTDPSYWSAVQSNNLLGFGMNYSIGTSLLPRNVPDQEGEWHMNTWPKWGEDAPERTGAFGGVVYGALKGGGNPDGGVAMATYWLTEEGLPLIVKSMGAISYKPALDLPVMQEPNAYYGGQTVLADLASVSYPAFNYFRWSKTEQVVKLSLEQVQLGQVEPEQAVDDIVAGLKRLART